MLTSGNVSDEPIAYSDGEAVERLGGIADWFLVHDRPIHVRADDSVVRAFRGGSCRCAAPGFAPQPLGLPWPFPRHVLACGAELKHTFCLAKGGHAFVSHHIRPGMKEPRPRPPRARALPGAVRSHRGPPGRPAPRVPSTSMLSRTGSSWRACSTTTPTWPPAWPTTASRGRSSGSPTTGSATAPTGPSGAAARWSPTWRNSGGPATWRWWRCLAGRPRSGSRGGWPRPGWVPPGGQSRSTSPWSGATWTAGSRWPPWPGRARPRWRPPAPDGCSTRCRRSCVRDAVNYEGQAAELEQLRRPGRGGRLPGPAGGATDDGAPLLVGGRDLVRAVVEDLTRACPAR